MHPSELSASILLHTRSYMNQLVKVGKGCCTCGKNNAIHRKSMHRIRSHPAVHVCIIPPCDLCQLRAVRCLSQSLDFLLGRLVLGCWVCELQRRCLAAGSGVRPYPRCCEARRLLRRLRHLGEKRRSGLGEDEWEEGVWRGRTMRQKLVQFGRRRYVEP